MTKKPNSAQWGFTLIEILAVVGVISLIAAGGIATVSSVRETARENKLETDVANLNSSVAMYQASGGDLSGATTVDQVLAKLKTRADEEGTAKQMGMKGSFVDVRTTPVTQSDEEADTTQSRAVWNSTTKRFAVVKTGDAGVKEFQLDASKTADDIVREARSRTLTAANVNTGTAVWVWDYTDATPIVDASGSVPGVGPSSGPGANTGNSTSPLSPPNFSVSGASRSLTALAALDDLEDVEVNSSGVFTLTISNPNTGVPSHLTSAGSVSISPVPSSSAQVVESQVISDDVDRWTDSENVTNSYSVQPETLSLSISGPSSLTYAEAGGAMANGSTVAAPAATISLSNASSIPALFENSDNFVVKYTADGTNPTTSNTAVQGSAFTENFVPLQFSLGVASWGTASSLAFNAVAISSTPALLTTSSVASQTVTKTVTNLLAPAISPASFSFAYGPVTVTISASDNNLPAGYRIFYTTDGSTPTTSSTLYTGAFFVTPKEINSTSTAPSIIAIVAGPVGYESWFNGTTSSAIYSGRSFGTVVPAGVLVSSLVTSSNVDLNGSLTVVAPADGSAPSLAGLNNLEITKDVLLPGRFVTVNVSQEGDIEGRTYDADGNEVLPNPDDRTIIKLEGGPYTPDTAPYTYTVPSSSTILGKVYTNVPPIKMPTVTIPTLTGTNAGTSFSGSQTLASAVFTGTVALAKNATIVLGTTDGTTTKYVFKNDVILNSGVKIQVVGPVEIYFEDGAEFIPSNGANNLTVGSSTAPENLKIYFAGTGGDVTFNNSSALYAQVVAPDRTVNFSAAQQLTFNGSITADELLLPSNTDAVVFSLSPIYGGYY